MKIIIKNGKIVNGKNEKSFNGDILLEDNKIKKIGFNIEEDGIEKIINAKGKVVCPGFIDTHSHSDLSVLVNPFNEAKVRQGITTEILGQDGISMAPLPKSYINLWRKNISSIEGESDEIDWTYENTERYLKMLEDGGVGINQTYLLPHGNVRLEAMGLESREATYNEIKKMCEITEREMKSGAIGLSSGLIYMPCVYSKIEELIEMCKVVKQYNGIFVVHQRSEADTIIESMKEIIEIGRQSKVKIHFSHFKICGKNNWKYLNEAFELLEQCKEEGIEVSIDQYPYAAGCTSLGVVLPPWVHGGGVDELLKRLERESEREIIKKDIKEGIYGWDNFIDFVGEDQIFVTSVKTPKNQDIIGKSLKEIGNIRGKKTIDATLDLIYEERNEVGMVDFYGLDEHIIKIMKRPEQNICTDGVLLGKPHPRAYGTYPRVLGRYVRELKVITLEEAIYKMTKKPADTFSIKERGSIEEGYFADLVIFDENTIIDTGDYIDSEKYPEGIEFVIVNGEVVLEKGKFNEIIAGQVLKRG